MTKKTKAKRETSKRVARHREINLSQYKYLCISFVNRKGKRLFDLEFSSEIEDLFQVKVDIYGPKGDTITTFQQSELDV